MNAGEIRTAPPAPVPRALPGGPGQAIWRGFRGRCPACGEGRLFDKFLKVRNECPNCGEQLHHHRADDFPAYLVIAIVGQILVPIVLSVETNLSPPVVVSMVLWPSIALAMALSSIAAGQRRRGRDPVVWRHARFRRGQEAADRRRQ